MDFNKLVYTHMENFIMQTTLSESIKKKLVCELEEYTHGKNNTAVKACMQATTTDDRAPKEEKEICSYIVKTGNNCKMKVFGKNDNKHYCKKHIPSNFPENIKVVESKEPVKIENIKVVESKEPVKIENIKVVESKEPVKKEQLDKKWPSDKTLIDIIKTSKYIIDQDGEDYKNNVESYDSDNNGSELEYVDY
jgi:hypothetical protein